MKKGLKAQKTYFHIACSIKFSQIFQIKYAYVKVDEPSKKVQGSRTRLLRKWGTVRAAEEQKQEQGAEKVSEQTLKVLV